MNIGNKGPLRSVYILSVLTLAFVGTFGWVTYSSFNEIRDANAGLIRVSQLRGEILKIDETLTMSARLGSASGDLAWEERYNNAVPLLDAALAEMETVAPDEMMSAANAKTSDANGRLIAMEEQSFALVKEGKASQGYALLMGPEYAEQKSIYADGMAELHAGLLAHFQNERDEVQRHATNWAIADGALFGLLLFAWAYVIRSIKRAQDALTAANANLEGQVRDRTRSIQLILDGTGEGLLTLDQRGHVGTETSKSLVEWFGPVAPGVAGWDYLFADDEKNRMLLEFGFSQILDGFLPFELLADQLPSEFVRADRTYRVEYKQVFEDDTFVNLLLVVRDVTSQLEARAAENRMRELHAILANAFRDRNGFVAMRTECTELLERLSAPTDRASFKRDLHTLKGSTAVYGFLSLSKQCHEVEDLVATEEHVDPGPRIRELYHAWHASLEEIDGLLPTADAELLELSPQEFESFLAMLERREPHSRLAEIAQSWKYEPTRKVLSRLAGQAQRLASQVNKEVQVELDDPSGLRLPSEPLRGFWTTLVHVIRNAVDHGIESADERARKQKPRAGRLRLGVRANGDGFKVEVEDDGAGIAWDKVRQRYADAPGRAPSQADLQQLIFADGISTRDVVSETSGRGVGLAAVRELCDQLGATIAVSSDGSSGTKLTFNFQQKPRELTDTVKSVA